MRPTRMAVCLISLLFSIPLAIAQTPEPELRRSSLYILCAPGVTISEGSMANLAIGGGAEGLIKGGFGVQGDLSYLFYPQEGFRAGFGLFSPGVFYQFHPNRKTIPFVTGGYSLAFRSETLHLVHYGGGLNHWFNNHWGIRFEVRNHTLVSSAGDQVLQFRFAFLHR